MISDENLYWPFDVLTPERRTEQHDQEIGFLETAHREGYRPYRFGAGNFGATRNGWGGLILVRGRRRWEVRLGIADELALSAHLDDFRPAADAVLLYLGGAETAAILEQIGGHLIVDPKILFRRTARKPIPLP